MTPVLDIHYLFHMFTYLLSLRELKLTLPIVYGWLGQKFHKHRETLINKHVSWKLRLKYFNAMISPTILFGLSSLPLTKFHFQKLNVVHRKMLRSSVGWVVVKEDDWRDTMKRMNDRLQSAMSLHEISRWSVSLFTRLFRYAWQLVHNPEGWVVYSSI